MSRYKLTPADIALYFKWGDFKHSRKKEIFNDVWAKRYLLLDPSYRDNRVLFKNKIDQALAYLQDLDYEDEYQDIAHIFKEMGSDFSPLDVWDEYSLMDGFFKLIMLRLMYTENKTYVRKKMRTILMGLGYKRRSQQLVKAMTLCCNELGISIFVRGGLESDFRNVNIDEWITFKLKNYWKVNL